MTKVLKEIKHKIEFDDDFDFDLLGLSCHNQDYQLAFNINQTLGFAFEKADEPYVVKRKEFSFETFSFYQFFDEEQHIEMYLLRNKLASKYLVKELVHVDYFLIIKENLSIKMKHLIDELRKISIVLHVQELDPNAIDGAKYLEF
jgi:hypothetical protein